MCSLLIAECIKLKRNTMFLLSILGACAAPLMCFVGLVKDRITGEEFVSFYGMLENSTLYTFILIGFLLYAIMSAYLFSREQTENTLKTIITLPVSKNKYLTTKYVMLFIWILFLSFVSWFATILFSFLGKADNPECVLIFAYLWKFMIGSCIIYVTLSPFVFLTLVSKNIVPTMIVAAIVTMCNVALVTEAWSMIFPWSAILSILFGEKYIYGDFPIWLPYIIVGAIGIAGYIASYVWFNKTDIT